MAGTVTVSDPVVLAMQYSGKKYKSLTVDWVADSVNGSVPNTLIPKLSGYLVKVITKPGATAPTANYSIKLFDPLEATADALAGTLASRSATLTEVVYPATSAAVTPPLLLGDHQFSISGNVVNSATGRVIFVFSEEVF